MTKTKRVGIYIIDPPPVKQTRDGLLPSVKRDRSRVELPMDEILERRRNGQSWEQIARHYPMNAGGIAKRVKKYHPRWCRGT